MKGVKQNTLSDRQGFGGFHDWRGEPKHQNAKQWQRAMPLGADAHGKVSRSPCVQVQHAENDRNYQQEQQVREREEKKREKQLLNIENTRSENGEQESERANQRAPFSHGPLSLQIPPGDWMRKPVNAQHRASWSAGIWRNELED